MRRAVDRDVEATAPYLVLGQQALIDLWACDVELLEDAAYLQGALEEAAKLGKVTIVGRVEHHFSPQGYTSALVLEESHMVLHTWPEHRYASLDLFSCNLETDFDAVHVLLRDKLRAGGSELRLIERRMPQASGDRTLETAATAASPES